MSYDLLRVEIRRYCTSTGKDVFGHWLGRCGDATAKAAILVRLARLEAGNAGDCKAIGHGVWELRIDHGPGYRVYFARVGKEILLLLCAGDKRSQSTDTKTARGLLADYRRRETQRRRH
jgi:putative addiction module killer protein